MSYPRIIPRSIRCLFRLLVVLLRLVSLAFACVFVTSRVRYLACMGAIGHLADCTTCYCSTGSSAPRTPIPGMTDSPVI